MQKSLLWSGRQHPAQLARLLWADRVAITATDTVFGLLAPLTDQGFNNLNYLKNRVDKPYLVLIGDASRLSLFIDQPLSLPLRRLIVFCWPGPVTLIFRAKSTLPSFLKGPDGTIALRVPGHRGLLQLLQSFKGLFSTSANRHGKPVPFSLSDIDERLLQSVSVVVSDNGTKQMDVMPSTILDCTQGLIRVVRDGAYPINKLQTLDLA